VRLIRDRLRQPQMPRIEFKSEQSQWITQQHNTTPHSNSHKVNRMTGLFINGSLVNSWAETHTCQNCRKKWMEIEDRHALLHRRVPYHHLEQVLVLVISHLGALSCSFNACHVCFHSLCKSSISFFALEPHDRLSDIQFCPGWQRKLSELWNGKNIDQFESWCSGRSLNNSMRFYHNKNLSCCPVSTSLKGLFSGKAR
jgi:hypothetical protein